MLSSAVVFCTYFNPFPNKLLCFFFLHYKSFENAVGKGEIARNGQFLLFPQCFLPFWTTSTFRAFLPSNKGLTHSQTTSFFFTCLQYKSFENTVGKEDIARNSLSVWR